MKNVPPELEVVSASQKMVKSPIHWNRKVKNTTQISTRDEYGEH